MNHNSDNVIFLLSTDWFLSLVSSIAPWKNVGQGAFADIQQLARNSATKTIWLSSNYFEIDLSDERRSATYAEFHSLVRSRLKKDKLVLFDSLISYITDDGALSSDEYWIVKAFFISESATDFKSDSRAIINQDLRSRITVFLESLEAKVDSLQIDLSSWDRSLQSKFGDMPDLLFDFVRSTFVSKYFFDCFTDMVSSQQITDESAIKEIANWIVESLATSLGAFVDANKLLSALDKHRSLRPLGSS